MRKPDLTTSDSAVTTWGLALLWPDLAGFGRSILTVASETTLPLTAAAAIVLALLVVWFAPAERKQVRSALALFGVSLALLFFSVVLLTSGHPRAYSFTRGLATLIQGIALINLAAGFVFDVALRSLRLYAPRILRDLLLGLAYITLLLVHLSYRGVDLSSLVATSAVITAVIGFSLQDTLGNIMGGLALQMERSINVGDWISVEGQEGKVVEIRWRQTTIETRNWETVIIPNSQLMKNKVIILGRRTGQPVQRRYDVFFSVDFRYPPNKVIAAVERALRMSPIPRVATEPKPDCGLLEFRESTCQYVARFYLTDLGSDVPTNSEVRTRIFFALKREGIPLAIPAQSLFLTTETAGRKSRKVDEELADRVHVLRQLELFRSLTEEERMAVARHLHPAPFRQGETIIRQGAVGHRLYIITSGRAEVRVSAGNGLWKAVATLKAWDIFGEMSLMTGEPRSAAVVALDDVQCYSLDKESFTAILERRPELAEDISHVLAQRRVELEAAREGLDAEAKRQRLDTMQTDILARMRRFFSLHA